MQRSVVVIEDDPSISELLQLYLAREGYRGLRGSRAATGCELVRGDGPALVVLDLMLPDGSGFDVLKAMRGSRRLPSSSSPPRTPSRTRSWAWNWAPTTTWSSRSARGSWWPGPGPCCGGPPAQEDAGAAAGAGRHRAAAGGADGAGRRRTRWI